MTIEDSIKRIQELAKKIQDDTSMHPAKRKAIVQHLESAEESLLKSESDYIKKEQIMGIAGKLTIIFVPLFMICLLIYSYGIPNYVPRESITFFRISIASFAIAMGNMVIAPGLYWMQHKIFSPKSA
ncbi:MAG: hypothetical protein WC788_00190 [Candidatus Paceibacterota bacterium]|jgi:hypothetical protein